LLKITFLGTGTSQGIPVIACPCDICQSTDPRDKRLRTSILIEDDHTKLVIDSGPDFRQQLLRASVKKLDGLVFTHEHKDHIAGMDDIRAFNYIQSLPVDIYATERVQEALKREFHYAFEDFKYPGVPELNLHMITEKPFRVGTIQLRPIPVLHYRLMVFGYRIGDFSYITDAKTITPEGMEVIRDSEVLVLNALRREQHVSHFTLEEALNVIKEVKPKKAYLIHLSHQMGKHADLEKELPDGVECAFDGLELYFR
jgi:phosphoribosyl 1,2-cyclic phosphate phosphodiesterase